MALILLNNVGNPYGQFDGYDNLVSSMLGGEVASLASVQVATSTDKKAKDIDDGYTVQGGGLQVRTIAQLGGSNSDKLLFLTDDGTTNYGTLFGTVVGGIAGQQVSGGAALGPHTMTGSGKVTLWQNTGMYGVTLDAVDNTSTGLSTSNLTLSVGAPILFNTSSGKLTTTGGTSASTTVVGRFVEFSAGDTLVTTPRSLTRVGIAGGMIAFKYVVINWNPPSA